MEPSGCSGVLSPSPPGTFSVIPAGDSDVTWVHPHLQTGQLIRVIIRTRRTIDLSVLADDRLQQIERCTARPASRRSTQLIQVVGRSFFGLVSGVFDRGSLNALFSNPDGAVTAQPRRPRPSSSERHRPGHDLRGLRGYARQRWARNGLPSQGIGRWRFPAPDGGEDTETYTNVHLIYATSNAA